MIAAMVLPSAGARATGHDMPLVGTWLPAGKPGDTAQLLLYPHAETRTVYAYATSGSWVRTFDLDTLQPKSVGMNPGRTTPTAFFVDDGGDLFVAVSAGVAGGAQLHRFGLREGALVKVGTFDIRSRIGNEQQVIGLYRMPGSRLLWALSTALNGTNKNGVKVTELDVPVGSPAGAKVNWTRDVSNECPVPMQGNQRINAALAYLPFASSLYFGCAALSPNGTQLPQSPGIGRLVLDGDPLRGPTVPHVFERFTRPGDFSTADSVIDVASGRMLISAFSGAAGGSTLYGFDAKTSSFVGGTSGGTNQFNSIGLDGVNGRVYGLSQDSRYGLLAADIRPTPLPQARRYPQYNTRNGVVPIYSTIAVDTVTHRLFLAYADSEAFSIVQDDGAPSVDPSRDDPDVNTSDVPEVPGRTHVVYSGVAQGFGSRYRWIGGPQNVFFNATGLSGGPEQSREFRGAYINTLGIGNGEASAAAIAAERDGNTARDQQVVVSPEAPGAAVPWPYGEARCLDFTGQPRTATEDGATAACDFRKESASLTAVLEESSADIGMKVGRSDIAARSRRDATRGTVVTVTSRAENIVVTDAGRELLRIGEVRVTTEAWARGRPGTAGSTYKREVKDVYVEGEQRCRETCTLAELDRLGKGLVGGRLSVRFPTPDPTMASGSKGGYQALVRRSLPEQLQEVVVNGQTPERVEVPGAVLTLAMDNRVRSRMILELAAVAAEARYGITRTSGDVVTDPDLGGGALVPLAALSTGDGLSIGGSDSGFGSPVGEVPLTGSAGDAPTTFAAIPTSVGRTAGLIWNGIGGAVRLFPIWAVLLAPVYLSARRWLLLQRDAIVSGDRL
ncbi:MAG: hypothetical protein KY443_01465 [Actinobacteria bacterium]|nr:hypothetical protein [Actinomycetota bacterium]